MVPATELEITILQFENGWLARQEIDGLARRFYFGRQHSKTLAKVDEWIDEANELFGRLVEGDS